MIDPSRGIQEASVSVWVGRLLSLISPQAGRTLTRRAWYGNAVGPVLCWRIEAWPDAQLACLGRGIERLRVYGYGCPPCMDPNLAERCAEYAVMTALRDDVVMRFSPQSLERLQKELCHLDLEAAKQVAILPCLLMIVSPDTQCVVHLKRKSNEFMSAGWKLSSLTSRQCRMSSGLRGGRFWCLAHSALSLQHGML